MTPQPKTDPIVPIPPAMELSYDQSSTLMGDPTFRGRVKVACLKFANAILDEPTATPAHNTRLRWATSAVQNPDGTAAQTTPTVVMDAAVQSAGSEITDEALQGAVETVLQKLM